jgi:hypothetical protein
MVYKHYHEHGLVIINIPLLFRLGHQIPPFFALWLPSSLVMVGLCCSWMDRWINGATVADLAPLVLKAIGT